MIKVEIDRSRWYRGDTEGSKLQREEDGKRCCLGFAALACGYEESDILGTLTPSELVGRLKLDDEWPTGVVVQHNAECRCGMEHEDSMIIGNMMAVNDNEIGEKFLLNGEWATIDDEEQREKILTELAAKVGMEFVFVGDNEEEP